MCECGRRTLDLASAGALVETLRVALLHDGERGVDENLDEGEVGFLVRLAGRVAVCAVGGDERGDRDARCVREQLRDLHEGSVRSR